jgi:multiple sugar transport system permease protein
MVMVLRSTALEIQAISILGALPLVILFLIFQRRILEGVAGSGLKG